MWCTDECGILEWDGWIVVVVEQEGLQGLPVIACG